MADAHRLEARQARYNMRDWAQKRRERTHHLIELGSLVAKAGLVELANDDRVVLYGAFLDIADALRSVQRERMLVLWRRWGSRAFKG